MHGMLIGLVLSAVIAQASPVQIVLPDGFVDLSQCQFQSLLTGISGGAPDVPPPPLKLADRRITIPVEHDGQVATRLRAFLWCARRTVWTLDVDLTRESRRVFAARPYGLTYLG